MRPKILGWQIAVVGLTLALRAGAAPGLYQFAPEGVPLTLPDGSIVSVTATFLYDAELNEGLAVPTGGTGYPGAFSRLAAAVGPYTVQDPIGGVGVFDDSLLINNVLQDAVALAADPPAYTSLPPDLQGFELTEPVLYTLVNVRLAWNETQVGDFLNDEGLPSELPPIEADAIFVLEFAVAGDPQDLTTAVALGPVVRLNEVIANLLVPDTQGSGDPEAVVVRNESTRARAEVLDYGTGTVISSIATTDGRPPADAAVVVNNGGTAADDIAFLVFDPARSRPIVEVRDTLSGQRLRNVFFDRGYTPVALAIVPDQNGNQSEELAVLATRTTNGRPRVLIRDLGTREAFATLSLPRSFAVTDLRVVPDFSGNAQAEVLVLARRIRDDKGFVLVWDTGGAGWLASVPVPRGYTPVDLGFAYGPGEAPSVAILTRRETGGTARLFFNDALTGARLWTRGWNRAPVALDTLILPGESDGIGVLTERPGDQAPIVSLMESDTNAIGANVSFGTGVTGLDFLVLPDLSVDPGTDGELSVLVRTADSLELRVRDAAMKNLIQTILIP